MNKALVSFIFSMALISGIAIADTGFQPCPLAFKFVTSIPGSEIGLNVELTYLDRVFTGTVNEYGELVMEMGNYGIADCINKDFILHVVGCDDPICTTTVSFNPNGFTTIDLRGADVCPIDSTPYASCNSCCTPCDTCDSCEVCEECPVQDLSAEFLVTAIVAAIVGLGVGKYGLGVKVYTNTKGDVVTQHKHRNIVGYHSVNTVHQKQPHRKGEIAPKYAEEKGQDGTYKYLG